MASIYDSLDEARIIERSLLRINGIGLAKGEDEVTYLLGAKIAEFVRSIS